MYNPSISSAFCGRSKANTVNCVALVTTSDQSLMLLKMPGNNNNNQLFYIIEQFSFNYFCYICKNNCIVYYIFTILNIY